MPGLASTSVMHGNVGASTLHMNSTDNVVLGTSSDNKRAVPVVTLEDLLWRMPLDQRPKIRVGVVDPTTGAMTYTLVPLQPEHVYLVKCDVEGFDVNVMHRLGGCGIPRPPSPFPPISLPSSAPLLCVSIKQSTNVDFVSAVPSPLPSFFTHIGVEASAAY
jgi:hypothetical protein